MNNCQALQGLPDESNGLRLTECLALLQVAASVRAFYEVHDDGKGLTLNHKVLYLNEMWATKADEDIPLLHEASNDNRIGCEIWSEYLDGHGGLGLAHLASVHVSHAAAPDHRAKQVPASEWRPLFLGLRHVSPLTV